MEVALPQSPAAQGNSALAAANLKAYLARAQKEIGDKESAALTTILQACHPEEKGTIFFSAAS
jgi:hypothetical protein